MSERETVLYLSELVQWPASEHNNKEVTLRFCDYQESLDSFSVNKVVHDVRSHIRSIEVQPE